MLVDKSGNDWKKKEHNVVVEWVLEKRLKKRIKSYSLWYVPKDRDSCNACVCVFLYAYMMDIESNEWNFSYSFLQFCSFEPKVEAPLFVDGVHGVGALNQYIGLLGPDVVVRSPRGESMSWWGPYTIKLSLFMFKSGKLRWYWCCGCGCCGGNCSIGYDVFLYSCCAGRGRYAILL